MNRHDAGFAVTGCAVLLLVGLIGYHIADMPLADAAPAAPVECYTEAEIEGFALRVAEQSVAIVREARGE